MSGPDGLLPGATVTITDSLTGRTQTTTSNESGAYSFERVPFGTYTVRVSADGFKTYVANVLKIDANTDYTLNPILEVGDVSVEVTVEAGAELVNASNAELSTTVSPKQILDLPINGRNPLSLLNLQAGVNATAGNHVNGQRTSSTNFTRDGINVQDNFIRTGGFVQDRPNVDDTGEFSVVTQNAGAELGGGGSAQIQLVTPRGGSEFHGGGYIYNRNSKFAANEFGNNATGVEKPFLNRNQYGGKVSGPFPFPGFGEGTPLFYKDKAYFFVNYERFDLRQQSSKGTTILLPQFRDGTFTYTATNGTTQTVNVLTGAGMTGPIPAASGGIFSVSPIIQQRILSLVPTAGNGTLSNGGLSQGLNFNQQNNDTRNAVTTRFDVDINDSNSVYFVYKYNNNADDRTDIDNTFNTVPVNTQGGPTQSYLLSYTRVFGSNFTNEIRGAYAQSDPFFFEDPNFPTDYVIGGLSFLTNPVSTFQAQGRKTDQYTIQDNASYIAGNHTMRFGLDFNAQRIDSQTNFNRVGIYNITGTANPNTPGLPATLFPGGISTTDRGRADALRYMLAGLIGSGTIAAPYQGSSLGPVLGSSERQRFEYETYGLYFSDQWRVTPELTLNLGMRWDYFSPLRNPDVVYLEPDLEGAEGFDALSASLLDPTGQYVLIGTNAGKPGQFYKSDLDNFGPVVGFAYSPQNRGGIIGALFGNAGVLRGGFRVGYINDEYVRGPDNAAGGNVGLDLTGRALNNGSINLNCFIGSCPGFTLPTFTPPPISYATGNANAGNFFNTIFAIDPNIEMQRNLQYNFGFQREIGFDTAIEIRYVGGRSDSLVRGVDLNQVIISDAFLTDFRNAQYNRRTFGGSGACADPNTGCLPVGAFFNLLGPNGAFLGSSFTNGFLDTNRIGEFALNLVTNTPSFPNARELVLNNPRAGVVDLLSNFGEYNYNALQMEIRRRFTDGLAFQANYTFGKVLTDIQGDAQTRFDPLLDNGQPGLEYARADHDRTHTININANYELPFGRGKRFLNQGGVVDKILGGWQLTSIVTISSGTPITILDPNGTLNRTGRSGRQTAFSNLTAEQIQNLIGRYEVNGTIYWIDPSVIAPAGGPGAGTATAGSYTATPGSPAFAGQVFFRNEAGTTGNLPRNFLNGPWYYNWDAGLIKNIRFGERWNVQLRAEAFNVLNNTNLFIGENSGIFNIGSTNFGKILPGNEYSPRIMQFAARIEF
ncbi:MAG: carboxypeptidase regulatory-like domain-containing protein [Aridibacter famidurans]|nr:carboxypeptidase regulatory-like domain-containing protein [Aridibacter famidurans]